MKRFLAVILLLSCCMASRALAQTCTTSATGLSFGTYQPFATSSNTTTSTITVTCNPGVVSVLIGYTIQIGTGSGGSFAGRSMSSGGGTLPYQIYTSSSYTQVWGDGTAGTSQVSDGYLLGVLVPISRNYTAYGVILAKRNAAIGVYSDTVAVLITY